MLGVLAFLLSFSLTLCYAGMVTKDCTKIVGEKGSYNLGAVIGERCACNHCAFAKSDVV